MKIHRAVAIKFTLGPIAICLYALGAVLGLVLMSVSAWQYAQFADNPNFSATVYSPDFHVILALLLAAGILLQALCCGGILFSALFLARKRSSGAGVALALLGTGLVAALTLEVIAVTLQWDRWEDKRKVLPQILETRTKLADFSADDWFGRELAWFQDTFECCGYNNGSDFSNGPGARLAFAEATALQAPVIPDKLTWRPRSCCDDFTVRQFECAESVASYNLGGTGCSQLWHAYLSNNQWALVGLAMAAGLFQLVLVQIPLWLMAHQLAYARKEGGLLDEEEEE